MSHVLLGGIEIVMRLGSQQVSPENATGSNFTPEQWSGMWVTVLHVAPGKTVVQSSTTFMKSYPQQVTKAGQQAPSPQPWWMQDPEVTHFPHGEAWRDNKGRRCWKLGRSEGFVLNHISSYFSFICP